MVMNIDYIICQGCGRSVTKKKDSLLNDGVFFLCLCGCFKKIKA